MRIGVIGCGTIATAVVFGIADDGHQITVSERGATQSSTLAKVFANVTVADNQSVVNASDVLFIGLMADAARDVLGAITFRKEQRVITFMAGASLAEVDIMVRPACAVAIMMPFPGIAQGGSPIMMQGDPVLINEIFGSRNSIFELKNAEEMAAYLCAQAVLSPVVRLISDAANWLGEQVSDKAQGEAFLRALVASSVSGMECEPLIEALNAHGGYNQRLRLHMEAQGMGDDLRAGLNDLL